MSKVALTFKPFERTPIDEVHTLDQLTSRFQAVQDGLPELTKNSKDQYARLGVNDRGQRQIIVLINNLTKSLGVLDFAGATAKELDAWSEWSSRTSSRSDHSADIEGGHGNGGKAFMVRGCVKESYIESCYMGKRTKMGFNNSDTNLKYRPGYFMENGKEIRDFQINDSKKYLDDALSKFGIDFEDLPTEARETFEKRDSFTLVYLSELKEWFGRRADAVKNMIDDIPEMLEKHPQAALSLETSSVWVMKGKQIMGGGRLSPQYPEPMPEMADLPRIAVPHELRDPDSKEMVITGDGDINSQYLQLWTSRDHLRASGKKRALNVIRVRNERNVVANWSVPELCNLPTNAFIYGEIKLPEIKGEHLAGADRHSLADTPLVRAVINWVEEQVTDLAKRIQQLKASQDSKEARDAASKTLHQIRDLMKEFLNPSGYVNTGENGDQQGQQKEKKKGRIGSVVHEIVLEPNNNKLSLANGTSVPLRVNFYEVDPSGDRLSVPGVHYNIVHKDPIIKAESRNMIKGISAGTTIVYVETLDGKVKSNSIVIEVVECVDAEILTPNKILKKGEQIKIKVNYLLKDGSVRDELLLEGLIDTLDMGKLNRDGLFTAGYHQGETIVKVRFGPGTSDLTSANIEIGSEEVDIKGKSGEPEPDIPLILMCGDEVPWLGDFPPEQRTHHGGPDYPTIIDFEPQFGSVIWINQRSKESMKIRSTRAGGGQIGLDTKTFQQFLAIKCFEILAELVAKQEAGEDVSLTHFSWRSLRATAEMNCAAFLDSAFHLIEDLTNKMVDREDESNNGKSISA